jgi:hypothetical protein
MRRASLSLGFLALLLVATAPAGAQTTYTSRVLFQAALGPGTTETFDLLEPVDFYAPPTPGSSFQLYGSLGAIDYEASYPDVDSRVVNGTAGTLPAYDWGTGTVYTFSNVSAPSNLALFLSTGAPFTGFGFDFGVVPNTVNYSTNFFVRLIRGSGPSATITGTYTGTANSLQFFGVIDATPFDEFELTWDTDIPILDNITTGTNNLSVTPEPASLVLVGTGLLLVGAAVTRRRR